MNTATSSAYERDANPEGRRGKSQPAGLREIGAQLQELTATVAESLAGLDSSLRRQFETRPYVTLGAAAGVGYVLAGGLPTRLTGILLGLGSRIVIPVIVHQLTALIHAQSISVNTREGDSRHDERYRQ